MNEVEFHLRPIEVADVLAGVRYAVAFDRKGNCVGRERQVRRCQRLMGQIVSSSGVRPRRDSAISINPVVRALEERYRRFGAVIEGHCSTCPHRSRNDCAGWAQGPKP